MSKIKVMVGQVWVSNGVEDVVECVKSGYVSWVNSGATDINYLHDYFTFKPANDLEWLAVNCDNFLNKAALIYKERDKVCFTTYRNPFTHSYGEWFNKRIELGLEVEQVEAKPVFTQAMADAGKFPAVGVSCEICYGGDDLFFKGSVIAYYNDMVWLNMEGKYPSCHIIDVEFRPIKTDEEKLVDELMGIISAPNLTPQSAIDALMIKFNITRKDANNE